MLKMLKVNEDYTDKLNGTYKTHLLYISFQLMQIVRENKGENELIVLHISIIFSVISLIFIADSLQ